LDGGNQHTHRDSEERWKDATQQDYHPPGDGEDAISLWQSRKELPFLTFT
jgi:hypothetical protein